MIDKRNAARMNIFFCADSFAFEGLGIALISMIRNCSDSEQLKIWILCSNTTKKDEENVNQLLIFEDFKGETEFIYFDAEKEFPQFRNWQGNKLTYGRFLIPDILKTGNAFYLDADIVVNLDILTLQNFVSDKLIGAVERYKFHNAFETDFLLNKLHLNPETSYFNAGILIINADVWHKENISEKLFEMANRYPDDLIQVDQTMLNILCNGNYTQIPEKDNYLFSRIQNSLNGTNEKIIHFVSSPKPWDIFGKIYKRYDCWEAYQTPFWKSCYKTFTKTKIKNAWSKKEKIAKYLLKSMLKPNNDN